MPLRTDIKKILIIGAGPIVIGQACEFDYSGSQGVKALKRLGFEVILVNSNPATVMTDPGLADRTYVEPLDIESLIVIIEIERPEAILATLGGQTALNLAMTLSDTGILEKFGVELIGATRESIAIAEDRNRFRERMLAVDLDVAAGATVRSVPEAMQWVEKNGVPLIIRPSFTLGGIGGAVIQNRTEVEEAVRWGLAVTPVSEILLEESLFGWKEFELEVMRDSADNALVVCSIENIDPLGVHTGDSFTVAPQMTLSDPEYQRMRNAALAVIRAVGVECGGSNIQFAVNPKTGRMVVVEMNPRVSRSSALASKATGFPIAKIAAQLAVGLTLDEIPNEITGKSSAAFEPVLDYVVVKAPRWSFEKFPGVERRLGTQMKSVGETMAVGRTFHEAFQKAFRGLEEGRTGWGGDGFDSIVPRNIPMHERPDWIEWILKRLSTPRPESLLFIRTALELGATVQQVHQASKIDPWFLDRFVELLEQERSNIAITELFKSNIDNNEDTGILLQAKKYGFSDKQLAVANGVTERDIRDLRIRHNIQPAYKVIDTCAGEFEAQTPYFYGTYDSENEAEFVNTETIVVIGGGPNRIGQGIEFDYCCVHALQAIRASGRRAVMINSNPETVSTDYDVADRLYIEPLTLEDVLGILDREKPKGVFVQFGGQTPLKLARGIRDAGYTIFGTTVDSIDRAEDRERFGEVAEKLQLNVPEWGIARTVHEALDISARIGYPLLVRPSYVLGGRGMEIVFEESRLIKYVDEAVRSAPGTAILLDRFLDDAYEFDVDVLSDGNRSVIAGLMQHIEEAGVHSGDSAAVLPPYALTPETRALIIEQTEKICRELNVIGLANLQFALRDNVLYILEVNPRASRTIPFVSKATGVLWAQLATRVALGESIPLDLPAWDQQNHVAVKEVVFPFDRFLGVNIFPGPEMRSTGEVMGIGKDFAEAFLKSRRAVGSPLPKGGSVYITVNIRDHDKAAYIGSRLAQLGFDICGSQGTVEAMRKVGVSARIIHKIGEGTPDISNEIKNGKIALVINTPLGGKAHADEMLLGQLCQRFRIPILTTLSAAIAAVEASEQSRGKKAVPVALQSFTKNMN